MNTHLNDIDLPYEEDILRNPYSLKSWIRYIDYKKTSQPKVIFTIYERALNQLHFSYKLWYNYLKLIRQYTKKFEITDSRYEEANNIHERALNYMDKMPRIWLDYLSFLKYQGFITRFRRSFDRCLSSLPSTQHRRIWTIALEFIGENCNLVQETTLRMYRRFIELAPEETEDFIDFLIELGRLDEASLKLVDILNDDKFGSKYSKSKFELWQKLCDITTKKPASITSLNVDAIVRQGISKYSDQVGVLWTSLADYYTRSNNLEHAKDIYEEAMCSVFTVADFTLIFNAYVNFYKVLTHRKLSLWKANDTEYSEIDIDMDIAKAEDLITRRPLLLNSVVLKQNPHNVSNWLERVSLYENDGPAAQLETFNTAINTIDVTKVTGGNISEIYIAMAALYERNCCIDNARMVFEKAALKEFAKVSDLVDIYCAHAEMEVRLNNYSQAMTILRNVVQSPAKHVNYHNENVSVADRVHRSLKLWALLIDLTENLCSIEETIKVYEGTLELHIVNPLILLNYADHLQKKEYFEQAFTVYQKGVSIFKWPTVYDIWLKYLSSFVGRYEGSQAERAHELFRSCLETCPEDHCKEFYLMYADYVEKYGLYKKALEIYERATMAVKKSDRYDMFVLYIDRVRTYCGVAATRPVYEAAVDALTDHDTVKMGLQFAEMETQLGEIDRARELYGYMSQFCDPRITEDMFWSKWLSFETNYGNIDTIGNYNLAKRSVEAKYNTRQSLVNVHLATAASEDSMQTLEANVQKLATTIAFVSGGISGQSAVTDGRTSNPEAMDLDDVYDDDDEVEDEEDSRGRNIAAADVYDDDEDMPVERPIPAEIYGSLTADK